MNTPRVSVVIPAYQAVGQISRCLTALRAQTVAPDEIWVVDDGSTDGTAEAARLEGAQVAAQAHQGPAAARNRGVNFANGEIILFTDSDCEPDAHWVEEMRKPFEDPGVVGVKGAYRTNQAEIPARLAQLEFEERYDYLRRSPVIDFVDTYSGGFRRDAFLRVGGFDTGFPRANNEDVDLSFRLAREGARMVFNPKAVVAHHHPASWWNYFRLKVRRGYWRMVVYRMHPGKAVRDSYTPPLLKLQILLLGMVLALSGLAIFKPVWWNMVGIVLCLLLVMGLPFARRAAHRDPRLALPAAAFVLLRSLAFGLGILGGLVGMMTFRSQRMGEHGARE